SRCWTVRDVRKGIFLLKALAEDHTPLLLNTMSADWQMRLFPNANLPDDPNTDRAVLRQLLSEGLRVPTATIDVQIDRNGPSMKTEQIKETADPEKRAKYGPQARYT